MTVLHDAVVAASKRHASLAATVAAEMEVLSASDIQRFAVQEVSCAIVRALLLSTPLAVGGQAETATCKSSTIDKEEITIGTAC